MMMVDFHIHLTNVMVLSQFDTMAMMQPNTIEYVEHVALLESNSSPVYVCYSGVNWNSTEWNPCLFVDFFFAQKKQTTDLSLNRTARVECFVWCLSLWPIFAGLMVFPSAVGSHHLIIWLIAKRFGCGFIFFWSFITKFGYTGWT